MDKELIKWLTKMADTSKERKNREYVNFEEQRRICAYNQGFYDAVSTVLKKIKEDAT